MTKITLPDIASGYNLSTINSNFQKIEDELNNKVLYRDSPAEEPNSMSSNLDMNSRSILNVGKISSNVLEIGGVQVVPTNLVVDPYNGTREALRRSLVSYTPTYKFTEHQMDKKLLTDTSGKPLTQGLFLEIGYSDSALYTLKDNDHEYNDKVLPSIKRLYLEMEDVTEYEFANKYFLGWSHWQRICNNKVLRKYIDDWRIELELKLRARAAKLMIDQASGGSYQAVKWLADRGWDVKKAGRPTKEDVESEKKAMAKIESEYGSDVVRLFGDS